MIAPDSPGEGRRVVSWAHGTTGMGDAACPSAQPDPARELTLYFAPGSTTQIDYGIPGLQRFVDDGWVVVATDYQGLGTPEIVGAACMSPGVPIVGLRQPGLGAAIGSGGPLPPDAHLLMILAGMAVAFPDTLSLDDVLTPVGRTVLDAGWNTQSIHHLNDSLARAERHEGPVMAVDPAKLPAWTEAFTAGSATLRQPVAPVLVLRDAQLDDGPCPTPWQLGYIAAVQALGGDVAETVYPDDDHFSLPGASIDHAREWLAAKF